MVRAVRAPATSSHDAPGIGPSKGCQQVSTTGEVSFNRCGLWENPGRSLLQLPWKWWPRTSGVSQLDKAPGRNHTNSRVLCVWRPHIICCILRSLSDAPHLMVLLEQLAAPSPAVHHIKDAKSGLLRCSDDLGDPGDEIQGQGMARPLEVEKIWTNPPKMVSKNSNMFKMTSNKLKQWFFPSDAMRFLGAGHPTGLFPVEMYILIVLLHSQFYLVVVLIWSIWVPLTAFTFSLAVLLCQIGPFLIIQISSGAHLAYSKTCRHCPAYIRDISRPQNPHAKLPGVSPTKAVPKCHMWLRELPPRTRRSVTDLKERMVMVCCRKHHGLIWIISYYTSVGFSCLEFGAISTMRKRIWK